MQKFTLYTWPDSQPFVGNDKCKLVLPKGDTTQLDSSYLVPVEENPGLIDTIYVQVRFPETQEWDEAFEADTDERILADYDGNYYVEEDLYVHKSATYKAKIGSKIAVLVEFAPRTRLVVQLPEGMSLALANEDPAFISSVSKAAREQMLQQIEDYLHADNMCLIEEDIEMPAREDEPPVNVPKAGSARRGTTIRMCRHTFHLENIKYGIHSEETCDFMADLFCDGKLIGTVENDGHGGSTRFELRPDIIKSAQTTEHIHKIAAKLRKVTWLRCKDGTRIPFDFGHVADLLLVLKDYPTPYHDKDGRPVWISESPDHVENEGGLHVRIFKWPNMDTQTDFHRVNKATASKGRRFIEADISSYLQTKQYI